MAVRTYVLPKAMIAGGFNLDPDQARAFFVAYGEAYALMVAAIKLELEKQNRTRLDGLTPDLSHVGAELEEKYRAEAAAAAMEAEVEDQSRVTAPTSPATATATSPSSRVVAARDRQRKNRKRKERIAPTQDGNGIKAGSESAPQGVNDMKKEEHSNG